MTHPARGGGTLTLVVQPLKITLFLCASSLSLISMCLVKTTLTTHWFRCFLTYDELGSGDHIYPTCLGPVVHDPTDKPGQVLYCVLYCTVLHPCTPLYAPTTLTPPLITRSEDLTAIS